MHMFLMLDAAYIAGRWEAFSRAQSRSELARDRVLKFTTTDAFVFGDEPPELGLCAMSYMLH